jgi:hypothetical protein
MVTTTSLWLPILLSAVLVFVASSIVHMVLTYHRTDYRRLPDEDAIMEALRRFKLTPGDYMLPCAGTPKEMQAPGFVDKMTKGPVAVMTVMPSGPPTMAAPLAQWFLYCIVVSVFAAYVTGLALAPGADYMPVFRFASTTAFACYALALWQNSIWYKRAWTTTIKSSTDGLLYALLTGGVFGWLWPN